MRPATSCLLASLLFVEIPVRLRASRAPRGLRAATLGFTNLPTRFDQSGNLLASTENLAETRHRHLAQMKGDSMHTVRSITIIAAVLILAAPGAAQTPNQCPIESVKVGGVCVDKFEASVWEIPVAATRVIRRVQLGNVTLADLTAAGAVQLGCPSSGWGLADYPANFPGDGNWTPVLGSNPPTPGVYAASVPGVLPSTCITQFQAAQACALSDKRLLRNDEWQRAAAGTPDPGTFDDNATDCETGVEAGVRDPVTTGSRANCKSSWGAFDMVGNVWEWVADWGDLAISCTDWTTHTGIAGGDVSCFAGPGGGDFRGVPGALLRGGDWVSGAAAGVFTVIAHSYPSTVFEGFGFRCAR